MAEPTIDLSNPDNCPYCGIHASCGLILAEDAKMIATSKQPKRIPMNYRLYIPYVNRPDLLANAIASLGPLRPCLTVINNSDADIPIPKMDLIDEIRPPVPLMFTQTMNLMQRDARAHGLDVFMFMHNDGECIGGAAAKFLEAVRAQYEAGGDWGAVFTIYDVLCAFNMRAVDLAGEWDIGFRQYHSDADYYYRMRRMGFGMVEAGLSDPSTDCHVVHRNDASSTKRADPFFAYDVDFYDRAHAQRYIEKWGGLERRECYKFPWNGMLHTRRMDALMATETFRALKAVTDSTEGNLLDITDPRTRLAQTEVIETYIRATHAERVLETGTNKGMFGYFLHSIAPNAALNTFGLDPASAQAEGILRDMGMDVEFCYGDTRDTLPKQIEHGARYDLAWIDGGHDYDPAVSDIRIAMALETPVILVDDGRLPSVERAVADALNEYPEYARGHNWLWDEDQRGIVILRKERDGVRRVTDFKMTTFSADYAPVEEMKS